MTEKVKHALCQIGIQRDEYAEILGDPYVRGIPLPRIPDYRAPAGAAAASAVQGTGSNCRPRGPRQTVILAAIRHYLSAISIVR